MKNIEEVRSAFISAAERHFSLLGFEKTTLDSICGESGKSKTSIYYHFKNKHDIFKSVIAKEFETMKRDLLVVMERKGISSSDTMREYFRTRLESLQRQGAYLRFASSRFVIGNNPVSRTVRDIRKSFDEWEIGCLKDNISKGMEEGRIPGNISADSLAKTIVDVLKALEIKFSTSEDKEEMTQTYNGLIDLIVR